MQMGNWDNQRTNGNNLKYSPHIRKAEKRNREMVNRLKQCAKYNTRYQWIHGKGPTLTREEKRIIAKAVNSSITMSNILQGHRTTWISPGGKMHRQIDYITINQRYRNSVTKPWIVPGWRAKITQRRQLSVIFMTITNKALQNYHKNQYAKLVSSFYMT